MEELPEDERIELTRELLRAMPDGDTSSLCNGAISHAAHAGLPRAALIRYAVFDDLYIRGYIPPALRDMVITPTIMTMSSRMRHWSVADAKARLSELMEEARSRPQTIERRGRPLVVVVSVEQFEDSDDAARWRRFVATSAEIRAKGGAALRVPERTRRRSPFART